MRKYLAATLLIAVAIGPAWGLGLGVSAGGVGLGASVSVGKNGVSVGISAGGAKVGASVGKNAGSSSGSRSKAGGKSGGISKGSHSGVGSSRGGGKGASQGGASGGAAKGFDLGGRSARGAILDNNPTNASGNSVNTKAGVAPATATRQSAVLPRMLLPLKQKRAVNERGEWGYLLRVPAPAAAIPATRGTVARICLHAIASAASPLGAVRVRAASAGPLHRDRGGGLTAPLTVRIDYAGPNNVEVRQARISCRLDSSGRVIAVI
ncbi:helicase [Sinorhizobium sp. 7-81]|uniref:helicase n=1 Tax=Sinorhizobium sp. 8-89 TaxID=3049089 RepID=UPI0024C37E30|nr:helicase [Sinorhizobium sp. 8-89]MDK1490861.1 helicase [Sinorhizobium sp. 8-89]